MAEPSPYLYTFNKSRDHLYDYHLYIILAPQTVQSRVKDFELSWPVRGNHDTPILAQRSIVLHNSLFVFI
jgi:hypothetical protein